MLQYVYLFINSKSYTYPIVARVRRDIMQILRQGINIHIEPPGIEYEKTVGTSMIGASFGLHIRNILDLKLGKFIFSIFVESIINCSSFTAEFLLTLLNPFVF